MESRHIGNPPNVASYDTESLRHELLIQDLFIPGQSKLVYIHLDRMIVGGLCPVEPLTLEAGAELRASHFLERREMGLINVGAAGTVTVDGTSHGLAPRDALYIGMGAREILFASDDPRCPAKYYLISTPAHHSYATEKIEISRAEPVRLGSLEESNERTIHKYIHADGVKSCQLVMGLTILAPGSVWNSMPCHLHARRMEVYFYFDLPSEAVVFHFLGEPRETRHLTVRNEEAVIAPSWSIHCGAGTRNYAFVWAMAGENQSFADMDAVPMAEIR